MSRTTSYLKDTLKLRYLPRWVALGFMWSLAQLPFRAQLAFGRGLGRVLGRFSHYRRRIVEINLALCFPEMSETERHRLMRRVFESIGMGIMEMQTAWWMSARRLSKLVTIEGLEHLEAAKKDGSGVILLNPHFTMLEIVTGLLTFYVKFDATYREHKDPFWDKMQVWRRNREPGVDQIFSRRETRAIVKALREGHVVWFAPDQDFGREQSRFVPFFGINAATITSTSRLARLGNARVVPFTSVRKTDGSGYLIRIMPALENYPSGDEYRDALRTNALFETMIRENPEQYLWSHRRFKTRPEGSLKLYPPKRGRRRRRPGE